MSESMEIGDALRRAREAKGLTLQDAAIKLRLMVRQVEAMEAEDYASLGQPVFARGFVRNYARLVGLDPDPLLAKMAESGAAPAEKTEAEPYSPEESSVLSPVLIAALIGLLLLLAIPTALYWWLNTGGEEEHEAAAAAQSVPAAQPAEPAITPETAPAADGAAQEEAAAQAGTATQTENTTQAEAAAQTTPPAASKVEAAAAAAKPAPLSAPADKAAPLPAPADKPAPSVAPESAAPGPAEAGSPARTVMLPAVPENPYLPSNFRNKSIRLQFDDDAWVQIRDGNGRTIHSMLNKAGSTVDLTGRPPFEFVIGNASQVQMNYNGRAFDIKPYIGQTVARFTLE